MYVWAQTKLATSQVEKRKRISLLHICCCQASFTGFLSSHVADHLNANQAALWRTRLHFALPGTVSPTVTPPCLPELLNTHNRFRRAAIQKTLQTRAAVEISLQFFHELPTKLRWQFVR